MTHNYFCKFVYLCIHLTYMYIAKYKYRESRELEQTLRSSGNESFIYIKTRSEVFT